MLTLLAMISAIITDAATSWLWSVLHTSFSWFLVHCGSCWLCGSLAGSHQHSTYTVYCFERYYVRCCSLQISFF